MANNVGSLVVSLGLDAAQYTAGLTKAEYEAKQRMERIQRVATQAVTAIGALGLGAAFVQSIQKASDYAAQIERLSKVANASMADFQGMAYAAKTVGIEQDKLADILKDVNDKVGDFLITGGGPLKDFFEQIAPKVGVTADEFRNLSGPQALQLYVSSLQKANVSQAEMTFFMEAIASDATMLLSLLQDNGKGFSDLSAEASNLGKVLDDDAIKSAKEFDLNLTKMRANLDAMQIEVGNSVIPTLNNIASAFSTAETGGKSFAEFLGIGLKTTLEATSVLALNVGYVLTTLGDTAGAYAAVSARLLKGDIEGAKAIGQAYREASEERRKALDTAENRIMNPVRYSASDQSAAEARRLGLAGAPAGTFRATTTTKPPKAPSGKAAKPAEMMGPDAALFWSDQLKQIEDAQRKAEDAIASAQGKAAQMYEATLTPLERLAAKEAEILALRSQGFITEETYSRARMAANDEYEASLDSIGEKTKEAVSMAQELGMTFTSAFEDAIVGGKGFSDVLKGIETDIARIIIRKQVTQPLANAIGSFDFSSLFSFAGGGYTGDGARSGGLDGQGGYLAMLHPQETVVDHAMGQGMGTTISQNITIDARGADAGVTERIMQAMRQTKAETLAAVQAQANRGGSFARAVGRA